MGQNMVHRAGSEYRDKGSRQERGSDRALGVNEKVSVRRRHWNFMRKKKRRQCRDSGSRKDTL